MNYFGHPHRTSKYLSTAPWLIDFAGKKSLVVEDHLDTYVTITTVQDIAKVVALAVEYKGEWPVIGGIRGSRMTVAEVIQVGEKVRGESMLRNTRSSCIQVPKPRSALIQSQLHLLRLST